MNMPKIENAKCLHHGILSSMLTNQIFDVQELDFVLMNKQIRVSTHKRRPVGIQRETRHLEFIVRKVNCAQQNESVKSAR